MEKEQTNVDGFHCSPLRTLPSNKDVKEEQTRCPNELQGGPTLEGQR